MKIVKRILIIVLVLAVVLAGAYGGLWYYNRIQVQKQAKTLASLQTVKVTAGSVTAMISATGNVRTKQSAIINWQTSGRVLDIKVKVGTKVAENDVLASLDPATLSNNLLQAQQNLISDQKTLSDLLAVDNSAQKANYQLAVVNAQKALTDAQTARANLNSVHGTQAAIDAQNAQILSLQNQVDSAQTAFDKVSDYDVTDLRRANALSNLTNLKAQLTAAMNNLIYLQATPTPEEIAKADANVAVAQTQLATAQKNQQDWTSGANANDVAAAKAKITADQATIDQQNVKAPFAGIITNANNLVGDMVNAGTAAFRIDDMSALYVDLQVSEIDINSVQLGQKVQLVFDAIPNKTYNGVVSNIGQVGAVSSGVVNYSVTTQLSDADTQVKVGMSASANIITKQVDNVLTVANRAIKTVGNQKVVYLSANGAFRLVRVTLGSQSDTVTELTSTNLKAGDTLVVNPPSNILALRVGGGGLGGIFGGLFGGGGGVIVPAGGGGFQRGGAGGGNFTPDGDVPPGGGDVPPGGGGFVAPGGGG